jgi:hypothetical protein
MLTLSSLTSEFSLYHASERLPSSIVTKRLGQLFVLETTQGFLRKRNTIARGVIQFTDQARCPKIHRHECAQAWSTGLNARSSRAIAQPPVLTVRNAA